MLALIRKIHWANVFALASFAALVVLTWGGLIQFFGLLYAAFGG